jgi:hypothetical protein
LLWLFLEMVSLKLFAQADLELLSSWSQPPTYLGLQVWAPCLQSPSFHFIFFSVTKPYKLVPMQHSPENVLSGAP